MAGSPSGEPRATGAAAALVLAGILITDFVPLVVGGGPWPWTRAVGDAAKLAFVLLVALRVWRGRAAAVTDGDWRRLAVAFGVIVLGDLLLLLRLHVAGVVIFALAQVALLVRHGAGLPARLRADGWRRHGRALAAVVGGAVLLTALSAVALGALAPAALAPGASAPGGGLRLAVGAAYALILAASLAAAWLVPVAGVLPGGRAVQAAAGMTLFFLCDLTVAGGQILPDPALRAVARASTFVAYAPALWLLASSGRVPASPGDDLVRRRVG